MGVPIDGLDQFRRRRYDSIRRGSSPLDSCYHYGAGDFLHRTGVCHLWTGMLVVSSLRHRHWLVYLVDSLQFNRLVRDQRRFLVAGTGDVDSLRANPHPS